MQLGAPFSLFTIDLNEAYIFQVANEKTSLELDWHGRHQFSKEPLKPWDLKGNVAGRTRSTGPLTYATIRGAGHMVSSALFLQRPC